VPIRRAFLVLPLALSVMRAAPASADEAAPTTTPVTTVAALPPPTPPAAAPSPVGQSDRYVGLGVAGAGVVGLSLGLVFDILDVTNGRSASIAVFEAHEPLPRNAATQYQPAMVVCFVAGGAALVTGAVIYFIAPTASASARNVTVGVAPVPQGGAFTVSGRF